MIPPVDLQCRLMNRSQKDMIFYLMQLVLETSQSGSLIADEHPKEDDEILILCETFDDKPERFFQVIRFFGLYGLITLMKYNPAN